MNMTDIDFDWNLVRTPINGAREWPDNSFAWIVKINGISFDYFTGAGLVKKNGMPRAPTLDDVLSSLILDSQAINEGFEDWCDNYGSDTDSRKALDKYLKCQENAVKLRKTGIDIERLLRLIITLQERSY